MNRPAGGTSSNIKMMKNAVQLAAWLLIAVSVGWAAERYPVSGMVLKIDKERQILLVSHDRISGYMDAMVMPFHVREPKMLEGLQPGMKIDFTLVVGEEASHADEIHIKRFDSIEKDPLLVRRLQLLDSVLTPKDARAKAVAVGQPMPDFALTDQSGRRVALSQFAGKVVALTFIYTRCPLPDYCLRLSNNFARVHKRFRSRMGRDLVLLTVTIDPQHDQPAVLTDYARIWKADVETWRFLTGSVSDVRRVCGLFAMDFWPEEGLLTHSLRTAVVDRRGKLAANMTGNDFSVQQLGDLVEAVMDQAP